MTMVPVKESHDSTQAGEAPAAPARLSLLRRIFRRRTLVALAAAGGLVLLFHYVLLPWAIRDRVRAALDEAGLRAATFRVTRATLWATDVRDLVLDDVNRVDRVQVRYDVTDLWEREVDSITVTGATLSADPRAWLIETRTTPTTAGATTLPKKTPLELPFNRLIVRESDLVLSDGRALPIAGTLVRDSKGFVAELQMADDAIDVTGNMAAALDAGEATIRVSKLSGELIGVMVGTYAEVSPVTVSGQVSGHVEARWGSDGVKGRAALEIKGGTIGDASDAQLTVGGGVFVGEASVGAATQPSVSVKLSDADIATPDLTARGVSGAVTFVDLSPPTSAPRQKLSAELLTIGETEFRNGQLEFEVNASGDIFVRQTRWDFLGGQVFANDVRVPSDGPVSFTLTASQVDVGQILATYAREKLSGSGKVSGHLPVVIDGRQITFGEGTLSSLAGGELRITDPKTLAQVSEVAGAGAAAAAARTGSAEQVKQNIAEALKDFEYDQMTARLTNESDGLAAYIVIKGHGRTGAKQALVYEPRIRRLDQLLGLVLDLKTATDRPEGRKAGSP